MESPFKWSASDSLVVINEMNRDFIRIRADRYDWSDLKLVFYHRRLSTTGSSVLANPHPWVYQGEGRTITFMHNGHANLTGMSNFYLAHPQLWDAEIQRQLTPDPFGFNNNASVDSGIMFAVLLMNIKAAGWDMAKGLQNALENGSIWESSVGVGNQGLINFMISDGDETYAYRSKPEIAGRLHFIWNENHAIISSHSLPANMSTLSNDEFLCIPSYGEPIRIRFFTATNKQITLNTQKGWHWFNLPVLQTFEGNIVPRNVFDMVADRFKNCSRIIYPNGVISTMKGGSWQHSIADFELITHPNIGLKLYLDTNNTVDILGAMYDIEPYTETFHPGESYWVTYNLFREQSIKSALGEHFDSIASVLSDRWAYFPDIADLDRPMEFGKTYIITLREDASPIQNFTWTHSRTRPTRHQNRRSTFFPVVTTSDYEVVEVRGFDNYSPAAREIAVYAGNTCIGATIIDEFPVQILVHTQGFHGTYLSYRVLFDNDIVWEYDNLVKKYATIDDATYTMTTLSPDGFGHAIVELISTHINDFEQIIPIDLLSNHSNFPNPFNPSTTITFTIGAISTSSVPTSSSDGRLEISTTPISISIYNIRGQLVKQLTDGFYSTGVHSVVWDGSNNAGDRVSSGVYFYRISSGDEAKMGKMLMIK
jgi:hypothetical protein